MQLTRFTDYATRILLYLAVRQGEIVSVAQIADHYGISRNHLAKVAQELVGRQYVETIRGRNGGLRLTRDPASIQLGSIVKDFEPNMSIVDCVGCLIAPVCGVPQPLAEATNAFIATLDRYTFVDLIRLSPGIDTFFPRK